MNIIAFLIAVMAVILVELFGFLATPKLSEMGVAHLGMVKLVIYGLAIMSLGSAWGFIQGRHTWGSLAVRYGGMGLFGFGFVRLVFF